MTQSVDGSPGPAGSRWDRRGERGDLVAEPSALCLQDCTRAEPSPRWACHTHVAHRDTGLVPRLVKPFVSRHIVSVTCFCDMADGLLSDTGTVENGFENVSCHSRGDTAHSGLWIREPGFVSLPCRFPSSESQTPNEGFGLHWLFQSVL